MADTIMVQAGPAAEPGKVILWEQNPDHPGGEAWIVAPEPGADALAAVEVARTADVEGHLRSGELIEAKAAHTAPHASASESRESAPRGARDKDGA